MAPRLLPPTFTAQALQTYGARFAVKAAALRPRRLGLAAKEWEDLHSGPAWIAQLDLGW